MEFFKKKSLLAIAAMFAATSLFVACGSSDPEPEPEPDPKPGLKANEVVFDNFESRELSDGTTGFTNGNMLAGRDGSTNGGWFVWEYGALALDHMGNAISDASWIENILGDGNMNIVFDGKEPTKQYFGVGADCYFFANGATAVEVDMNALSAIKIKGKIQGAVYLAVMTNAWDTENVDGNWGWSIVGSNQADEFPEMVPFEHTLNVNEGEMTGTWGNKPTKGGTLAEGLAKATGLTITLETEKTDYTMFAINEIVLVFKDEASIPLGFKATPAEGGEE